MPCLKLVAAMLALLWLPTICCAAGEAATTSATTAAPILAESVAPVAQRGLVLIDWIIITTYAASTLVLGWYYGRQQTTTKEYFLGSGQMNPFLIGVSLFATLLSTISYLSMPGEVLGKGPGQMATLLAYPLVFVIIGYGILPIYMKYRVTSAYELLEHKLGLSIRLLGATLFVVLRLVWMSLMIYLTSKALVIMMGVDSRWIPLVSLVTGAITIVYTSMGGLRAVVITDLMQATLLYGGAVMVLGVVTYDMGGFGWFPTEWQSHWDTQPVFSWDPSTRVTIFGSMLSFLVWHICTAGGDQTSVQRFMSTRDAQAARRALATQLTVAAVVAVTLALVGCALLGYFRVHPEQLPAHMSLDGKADDIFPRFIAFHLPVGISGLVVSAMLAAAMSSLDSGVNSITAVVMTDYLDRFGRSPKTEKGHVLASRLLALGIGMAVVLGSSLMDRVPGNITAVTSKTSNLLAPSIFCLFVFALFVPFAKPAGVWIGAFCGTAMAIVIGFSGPLFGMNPETGTDPVSFQWIGPISVLTNLVTGTIACLVLPGQVVRDLPETEVERE